MIYLSWIIYIFFALFLSYLARSVFKSYHIKKFFFAAILSSLVSVWFSFPGLENFSPILSILIMDIFETQGLSYLRLVRPFMTIFFIVLLIDYILVKKA